MTKEDRLKKAQEIHAKIDDLLLELIDEDDRNINSIIGDIRTAKFEATFFEYNQDKLTRLLVDRVKKETGLEVGKQAYLQYYKNDNPVKVEEWFITSLSFTENSQVQVTFNGSLDRFNKNYHTGRVISFTIEEDFTIKHYTPTKEPKLIYQLIVK